LKDFEPANSLTRNIFHSANNTEQAFRLYSNIYVQRLQIRITRIFHFQNHAFNVERSTTRLHARKHLYRPLMLIWPLFICLQVICKAKAIRINVHASFANINAFHFHFTAIHQGNLERMIVLSTALEAGNKLQAKCLGWSWLYLLF